MCRMKEDKVKRRNLDGMKLKWSIEIDKKELVLLVGEWEQYKTGKCNNGNDLLQKSMQNYAILILYQNGILLYSYKGSMVW